MYVAQPIEWTDRGVVMLDQRLLPVEEVRHTYTDYREVARAIREMVIRGARAWLAAERRLLGEAGAGAARSGPPCDYLRPPRIRRIE